MFFYSEDCIFIQKLFNLDNMYVYWKIISEFQLELTGSRFLHVSMRSLSLSGKPGANALGSTAMKHWP